MGAASGSQTLGNLLDCKSPLGAAWGEGLSDLEVHCYEPLRELNIATSAAVLVVRRRGWPEQQFVVKAFASCHAADLAKGEAGPLQEAMLLRGLHHANIVKYVEAWWTPDQARTDSGRLSLVMEYAEDGDLHTPRRAMLRQGEHLQEVLIGRWLKQILEALSYLHSRGVVHRDLKTSNVFLKDSWATALLGDFGISAVLARSTFTKTCAGTPAYMSPEAVRSERYGMAVDVWAVGIILYELLALQLPFVGTLVALIYKICCTEAREAPLKEAGYSDGMISLVSKVLAKEAAARPTAKELLDNESWSSCPLDKSEEFANIACSAARRSCLLLDQRPGSQAKECLGNDQISTAVPILQSWSSSEPSCAGTSTSPFPTPLHGPLSPGPRLDSDFYEIDDTVTRDATSLLASHSGVHAMPAYTETRHAVPTTDADEVLREELHAAHAAGLAMTPDYLEALLVRLGASTVAPLS